MGVLGITTTMTLYRFSCFFAGLLLLAALAAPALAQDGTGLVRFTSTPGGALVYIDGTYRGVTPTGSTQPTAIEVTADLQHTARLVKKGYQDYTTSFSVGAGQFRDISATLARVGPTPASGTITVRSSPGGARVYIDGTYYGTTPVQAGSPLSQAVGAGRHRVSVERDGYATYSTTIDVVSGQASDVQATLTSDRADGAIQVSTNPSGATVTLDHSVSLTAPATFPNVAPGVHTIVATLDGYGEVSGTIQVNPGQTAQASLTLRPASTSVGAVRVQSIPPAANIYLDGVYRGSTPMTIGSLAAGDHTVLLRRSGYREYTTTVRVPAGGTAELTATLSALSSPSGSVDVVSYPAGASVYLDDTYQGLTNPWDALNIPNVAPGEHDLTLTLGGYYDYVTTVTVTSGRETSVVATLTDLPGANPNGQLAVASSPAGAGVYVDNAYRGITPLIVNGVPKGSHTVLVRQAGYQDWASSVQVAEGETAQVSATLVPGGTPTATATLTTAATAANGTPTTAAPTTTRSGPAAGLAFAGAALAGLLVLRARP
jgi:hypothetical protein